MPTELQQNTAPSIVYSIDKTLRSKIFNYKQTVMALDCKDLETYGTVNFDKCKKYNIETLHNYE